MNKGISFIHCSDLHLGCEGFDGIRTWEDYFNSLDNIIEFAICKRVDYFFISGDIFNRLIINEDTFIKARGLFLKLKKAGISTIATEGNHDLECNLNCSEWFDALERDECLIFLKTHFMEEELELNPCEKTYRGNIIRKKGIRIIGLGYISSISWAKLEKALPKIEATDDFTVLLIHATVERLIEGLKNREENEICVKLRQKIDYIGLGHLHGKHEEADFIFNPGSSEYIREGEMRKKQEKGFYYVKIQGRKKEVTFIPTRV